MSHWLEKLLIAGVLALVLPIIAAVGLFLVMCIFGRPNPFGLFGVQVAYIRWSPHDNLEEDVHECNLRTLSRNTLALRGIAGPDDKAYAVCVSGIPQNSQRAALAKLRSDTRFCVSEIEHAKSLDTVTLFPYLPNCICLDKC